MRRVAAIIAMNVKLVLADRAALMWLLAMPIVFTLVTGVVFRGGGGGEGPTRYALTVVNSDTGPEGGRLLDAVRAADEIDVLLVEGADAEREARELVEGGERSAALVIPAGMSDSLLAGEKVTLGFIRNPERMNPIVTRRAIERALATYNAEKLAGEAILEARRTIRGEPAPAQAAELSLGMGTFVQKEMEDPSLTLTVETLGRSEGSDVPAMGFQHSSPAMALMYVLLSGLMLSTMLVEERRERTLSRLLSAPVRRSEIVAANLSFRFVIGMIQMWFLIGFGALVFRVDWGDSFLALVLVTAAYVVAVAGLSVLIGSLSRSSRRAATMSLVLALSMCALGGLWWPLEITPRSYQTIGHLVPTGWAMDAMHNLVSRGYGLAGVMPQVGVLGAFALIFSAAAVAAFRYE
jgi:ABC-2 type transport system permease protein